MTDIDETTAMDRVVFSEELFDERVTVVDNESAYVVRVYRRSEADALAAYPYGRRSDGRLTQGVARQLGTEYALGLVEGMTVAGGALKKSLRGEA